MDHRGPDRPRPTPSHHADPAAAKKKVGHHQPSMGLGPFGPSGMGLGQFGPSGSMGLGQFPQFFPFGPGMGAMASPIDCEEALGHWAE